MRLADEINLLGLKVSAQRVFSAALQTVEHISASENAAPNLREAAKQACNDFSHIKNFTTDDQTIEKFICPFLDVADMEILLDPAMQEELSERLHRAKEDIEGYLVIMDAQLTDEDADRLSTEWDKPYILTTGYAEDMLRLASAETVLSKADRAIKRAMT